MKYIGNKSRLLDFIWEVFEEEKVPHTGTFCDMFTGTTSVAQSFKSKGFTVMSNDIQTYSYVFQYAYIKVNKYPPFQALFKQLPELQQQIAQIQPRLLPAATPPYKERLSKVISYLNQLEGQQGFIYNNYAPGGTKSKQYQRQFFKDENAKRIDAIRNTIQHWRSRNLITEAEFYILLASLIDAADFVANMSGTYGAFLKIWRSMALKDLKLKPPALILTANEHQIYQRDANELVREVAPDILYLDPPYTPRQYAANFHILETLACWDNPAIYGKTGLRPYKHQRSDYCYAQKAKTALLDLVQHAHCRYVLMSYNNEGILSDPDITEILTSRGKLTKYEKSYRRFRTERDHEKRQYKTKDNRVTEMLYVVRVDHSFR